MPPAPSGRENASDAETGGASQAPPDGDILALSAEVERLTRERDSLRDALARSGASRKAEAWPERLIERSPLGIFRTDPEGRFLQVNPAFAAMVGYDSPEDLIGEVAHELLTPERTAGERPPTECGDQKSASERRWVRRDGSEIVVRVTSATVRGTDGDPEGCEATVEDITEQRRLEALRRQEERLASLGRMFAGIAHELNNPLAAICGFAQLLRRTNLDGDDRAAIETIEREGQRAASIVRQLLAFARHDGSTRVETVDVSEVLGYTARSHRYALETHGIRCLVDVPEAPLWIVADRAQLEQALLNLLVNARQACEAYVLADRDADSALPSESRELMVRLAACRSANNVCIEVADNGIGIPEEHLSMIWDPFFSTKAEGEGSGLGLSVVHASVESLGGTIDVHSVQGEGTSFRVRFPAAPAPELLSSDGDSARTERSALDILLVGSAPIAPAFAERLLGAHGHAVISAPGVQAATLLLGDADFDVVIINLPTSGGSSPVEVVKALGDMCTRAQSRVVVASRRMTRTVRDALEQMDGVVMLDHPGDVNELLAAVER